MFTTLPVELQDEVWKCYLVQNPQMLTLPPDAETRAGYSGNPSLILRQINQRLRAQPLAAYGNVSTNFSKLFHPHYALFLESGNRFQLLDHISHNYVKKTFADFA